MSFDLERFIQAQNTCYLQVKKELQNACKVTCWMWFVFPILKGLGDTSTSIKYAINSLSEAKAYLENQILNERLNECCNFLTKHKNVNSVHIFGQIDSWKFQACLTLFSLVSEKKFIFHRLLEQYFNGEPHQDTLKLLNITKQL
jgi:uncharacterized protein (DUF1810 family)